jgi:hypothetical protein
MRPIPLLVPVSHFRIGLQAMLAGIFPRTARREDARDLPDYLKRDIGLNEHRPPDWERLLR